GYQGFAGWEIAEAYGNTDIWANYAEFQIDFHNQPAGHRDNIMNSSLTEIGIGTIHGGTGLPHVGPVVTTGDMGTGSKHFIVGVVYNDKNHNGFYDIGEGIAGI